MHDVPNISTAFSVAIAVIKNGWIGEFVIFLYSQIDRRRHRNSHVIREFTDTLYVINQYLILVRRLKSAFQEKRQRLKKHLQVNPAIQ